MIRFGHAAIAAALLASAGAAGAQTTVIARKPVAPPPPNVEYRVGTPVPGGMRLYRMPPSVAIAVPAVKAYRYMVVNGEAVLVDPATSEVVAELSDQRMMPKSGSRFSEEITPAKC